MPVIVDEIVITVEVASPAAGSAPAAPGAARAGAGEQRALVSECVEAVLDVLRRKEER
ncbi:MAG: DUF5908 family protein [Betaproteobacteria bacterium]|nr:DUF5908 family protein [Betaproteobacteria bacterium]MDH5578217.1 DUF5908 family protein [Betaproteobacteria bacterium]